MHGAELASGRKSGGRTLKERLGIVRRVQAAKRIKRASKAFVLRGAWRRTREAVVRMQARARGVAVRTNIETIRREAERRVLLSVNKAGEQPKFWAIASRGTAKAKPDPLPYQIGMSIGKTLFDSKTTYGVRPVESVADGSKQFHVIASTAVNGADCNVRVYSVRGPRGLVKHLFKQRVDGAIPLAAVDKQYKGAMLSIYDTPDDVQTALKADKTVEFGDFGRPDDIIIFDGMDATDPAHGTANIERLIAAVMHKLRFTKLFRTTVVTRGELYGHAVVASATGELTAEFMGAWHGGPLPDIQAEQHSTCAVTNKIQVRMQRWRPLVNYHFAKALICNRPNCARIIQQWARPDDDRFCSGTCHRAVGNDRAIADVARAAAEAAAAALPSGGPVAEGRLRERNAAAARDIGRAVPRLIELAIIDPSMGLPEPANAARYKAPCGRWQRAVERAGRDAANKAVKPCQNSCRFPPCCLILAKWQPAIDMCLSAFKEDITNSEF